MKRPTCRRKRRLVLETLESRQLCAIAAVEQYFVYRLNYARANPVRYQNEQGLSVDLSYVAPSQPLAVVDSLFNSTEAKVNDMIANNYFAHSSPTGLLANKQVRDFGYALPQTMVVGGSIYAFPDNNNSVESLAGGLATVDDALDALIVDQGVSPPGHRNHLLSITDPASVYNEVGVGYAFSNSTAYRHYWAIHAATRDPSVRYVTGVAYNDADNDSRYDQGEGLAGVTINIPALGLSTTTNAAGGWAIAVPDGEYEIRAQGGGYSGTSTVPARVSGQNVEVDFRSGKTYGQVDFANWVNSAPVLNTAGNPTLNSVFVTPGPTPTGTPISALLNTALTDVDPVARQGIAITSATNSLGGTWQYYTGGSWTNLPSVSLSNALLLRDVDQLRYVSPSTTGTATISYHGWDQTSGTTGTLVNLSTGTGGSTAFSTAEETASITAISANRSPVLNATGNQTLPNVPEDATNPSGATVAAILGATVSDVDTGTQVGLAVSSFGGNGNWEYSLTAGSTWQSMPTLPGGNVLPLRSSDLIRFVPAADFNGTSTINYFAWDQFQGEAGAVMSYATVPPAGHEATFSTASDQARVTVTAVNDAPVLASGQQAWLNPAAANSTFNGGGTLVSDILGQIDSDVDPGALRGIAIISKSTDGTWWFRNDGGWSSGTTTDANAWVLKSTDKIQFVPNSGFTGTTSFTFRAWDQTTGPSSGRWVNLSSASSRGGTTAFSAQTQTATIYVGSAGTAPAMSSITRADANPPSDSARFNVTFTESVVNVTAADFSLVRVGSANGTISAVTGSGTNYVVTVSDLSGSGTLGLALASGRDIRDSVGNLASTTTPGVSEKYDIASEHVTIILNQTSVAENAGTNAVLGTVTLDSPAVSTVVVSLFSDDTTEATVPTTVTINAGQSTANFFVHAVDDQLLDGTQSVTISAAATGYLGTSQTLDVMDYETLSVGLSSGSISENGGSTQLTVTRSNTDTSAALVVTLNNSNAGLINAPATITIPSGQASASITLNAQDDTLLNGTRSTTFTASATGYVSGNAALNVTDYEFLTLSLDQTAISEAGGTVQATIRRSNTDVSQALSVVLVTNDSTELPVASPVTIPAGQSEVTFTLTAADDNLLDGTQLVMLSADAVGYVGDTATIDVEDAETLTLNIDTSPISENGGVTSATVTRSNIGNLSSALVVTLSSNDTSEATVPTQITIPTGVASVSFDITGVDDLLLDGPQDVMISASAVGYTSAVESITVTDYETITLQLSETTISENGGSTQLTVTRSNTDNSSALIVALNDSNLGLTDAPATITIPSGQASASITLSAQDDTLLNGTRSTTFTASAAGYVSGNAALNVTDYEFLTLGLDQTAISEAGGTVQATIRRSNTDVSQALSVVLVTNDSTELPVASPVTIPAGQSEVTVILTAADDNLLDGTQLVMLTANATGYVGDTATIDVEDAETLTLSIDTSPISENGGVTSATVTRSNVGNLSSALVVTLSSNDTSEAAVPTQVIIPAGVASVSFDITAVDDLLLDGPQDVTISASAVGYTGAAESITVTDYETITLQLSETTISENGGSTQLTVTRSNTADNQAVTVFLTNSDSGSLVVPTQVTIPANQASFVVNLTTLNDDQINGQRIIDVSASAVGFVGDATSVTVTDDDLPPYPWHNDLPGLRSDIDEDGTIGISDLLWAVTYYRRGYTGPLEWPPPTGISFRKVDVNRDNMFGIDDIVTAIYDYKQTQRSNSGESAATVLPSSADSSPPTATIESSPTAATSAAADDVLQLLAIDSIVNRRRQRT